jgi:hypothetical protein
MWNRLKSAFDKVIKIFTYLLHTEYYPLTTTY